MSVSLLSATPNYGFTLPTIGGDQNTWGNELNGNWSSLDTILHNLTVAAGGSSASSLPLTGGTLTGTLSVNAALNVAGQSELSSTGINGSLTVSGNEAVAGTLYPQNMIVEHTANFGGSVCGDFEIFASSASSRVFQWAGPNVNDSYSTTTATRYWSNGNGIQMQLDIGSNLTLAGNASKPGGGSWSATSDDRTKRNVAPYTSGLDAICRLLPIAFEYNGEGDTIDDGKTYYGLSAQQAQGAMPELVSVAPNGYLQTQLGPLLLAACNALRELHDRLVVLEHAA